MLPVHPYSNPVSLFFGYAVEDEDFQVQLHAHFANLRQQKLVKDWDLRSIRAGQNRNEEIDNQLNIADIILLLISANFMNSDYCCSVVMARAMERHHKGEAKIIPIVLSCVDIVGAPFSELEMLPKGNRPVTSWEDPDKAYVHITSEIRKVIYGILGLNETLKDVRKKHHAEQDGYGPCPYLGVKPYSERDASLFFGRETYVLDLMHKLSRDQRLLLVLGPVGSGKTSVIQAGIIPLLRTGSKIIPRSFNWEILTCIPGESPSSQLLSLLGVHDMKDLVEGVKLWKRLHPKSERLVLVMDQFEELFRLAKPEEQKYFIVQLLKLIIHDVATIIITMSDAYYSDLAEHADFITVAEQQISNIPPLQSEEIINVIRKPAKAAHLHFEDNLAEKIVDDTMRSTQEPKEHRRSRHSSVLPHLSVCLEQLWELQEDHYVTLEDYESIGQVSGALTVWATEAFHELNEKQQYLARRIFVDLVALGDNSEGRLDCRRQKPLTKLCHHNDEMRDIREVVEKLAKARLLETQLNEQKKDIEVKIIHESLLREWNLLKDWLREDHQFLLWYQEFEHHMQKWLGSNENFKQRDTSYLLRGRMLTEAQQWVAEQPHRFTNEAQDFVLASGTLREQEEQQERAFQEIQARQRITQAKQLATKALLMQEQEPRFLRKSLLIAVEALRRHHCVEADRALRQGLTLLPRFYSRIHMATGRTILFSGNGQSLATAGANGVSWIYNVDSPDEFTETVPLGNTHAIAVSYNGEYLLAGVSTGVTWFINTMKACRVAMVRQNARIHCVALTQRQPYIAAIGYDDGIIRVYQFLKIDEPDTSLSESDLIQHAKLLHTFHHDQAVSSLSFSHDERYLVSGGMDQTVRVWSKEGGPSIDTYDFKSPICSTLFNPDDTSIAIVSESGRAYVWLWEQKSRKMWKRKQDRVIRIPQADKIQAAAFGPGGNCLTTASVDGFARIWNLWDMIEVKLFRHNSPVSSICYHQSKDWLATACTDGNARIYSIVDGRLKYSIPHDTSVPSIALSSQKPYLATADSHGCVWIWRLHDGNLPICFHHSGKIVHLIFDRDNNENVLHLTIDFLDRVKIWTISLDFSLASKIYEFEHAPGWSITSDERRLVLSQENKKMRVFSCDGRYIADITIDGFIKVMKISSNNYENTLKVSDNIEMLAFSQHLDYIAFATNKGQILLWKWREKNNEPIALFHIKYARALVFSRDDEYLIVADNKKRVLIWRWKTQTKEPDLVLRHEESVHTISLCPDKRYLITMSDDKSAKVWDITTGLLVQHLPHKGDVVSATFDGESKYIATASADHTVGIWNAYTGEQLACLPHDDRAYAVAFSKDGRYLATACDDSIVRIWQWKQDDLEKEAKLRLMGNLTCEEWQEYIGNEPYQETFVDLGWRELPQKDPFDE